MYGCRENYKNECVSSIYFEWEVYFVFASFNIKVTGSKFNLNKRKDLTFTKTLKKKKEKWRKFKKIFKKMRSKSEYTQDAEQSIPVI